MRIFKTASLILGTLLSCAFAQAQDTGAELGVLTVQQARGILAGATRATVELKDHGLSITTKNHTWAASHDGGIADRCNTVTYTGNVGGDYRGYSITLKDNRARVCEDLRPGLWEVSFELHNKGKTVGLMKAYGDPQAEIMENAPLSSEGRLQLECKMQYRCPGCALYFKVFDQGKSGTFVQIVRTNGRGIVGTTATALTKVKVIQAGRNNLRYFARGTDVLVSLDDSGGVYGSYVSGHVSRTKIESQMNCEHNLTNE